MGYVLAGIIVLLLIGAFVTYLVLQATRRSSPARARDTAVGDRDDRSAAGVGADATPLGDTAEHAGRTSAAGETVGGQDAERSGGTGHPVSGEKSVRSGDEPTAPEAGRRFQRDPVGGEAEARPFSSEDR